MNVSYKDPKRLYHGTRVDVLSIEADHPKGGTIRREVVSHPGAVVILPLLDAETILLIRNERYVVQERLWELPAGTLEPEEDPAACAARELTEETGYRAEKITPLLEFYTTPGFCNERIYVYTAQNLTHVGQQLDETEEIEVVPLHLEKIQELIFTNAIRDAKTLATLLFYLHHP